MISNTTISKTDTSLILARRIGYKFIKIEFNLNVKAVDTIPYFTMSDKEFLRYRMI